MKLAEKIEIISFSDVWVLLFHLNISNSECMLKVAIIQHQFILSSMVYHVSYSQHTALTEQTAHRTIPREQREQRIENRK